ncbi:MAG TPA: tetratricopeptide repeat protein [Lacunisphaera sp.]
MVSLVFGLVLICYWPALHGALLWDDPAHVPRLDLRSWDGLRRIWLVVGTTQQYYPVLFSAFWLEHRLWGDNPLGYHLMNVVLHAISCCFLALLLRRLWNPPEGRTAVQPNGFGTVPPGTEWFVALVFAVHPICVESVAWITEQKNTLSLFFYLLAGLAYLKFDLRRSAGSYAVAFILFLLALGSKTSTVTLPAALLVIIWWRYGNLRWRRDVAPLLPWFVVATGMGLFTSWVERKLIGAEGVDFELSLVQRGLLAGRVIWFYAAKLLWPVDLNFFYRRWDVPEEANGWIGYLLAAIVVTVGLWAIRRRSRGPLAGWLLFVGTLFPILGFFKVFFFRFSYVNDHFVYLASLGVIATTVGAGAATVAGTSAKARMAGALLGAGVIGAFSVLTFRQSQLYRNNVTLFRSTILKNPSTWMGHHILAFSLAKNPGTRVEAVAEYREALRLNPEFPDSHLGLGVELAATPGGRAEAIVEYERALALRPNYAEAHNALGVELARTGGHLSEAVTHYEQALRIKPDFTEAQLNLANALTKIPGRTDEAFGLFAEVLRLRPNYVQAHSDFADALAATPGKADEAVAQYREALRLNPDSVAIHFRLANTLVHLPGRLAEALSNYETVLRLKPDFADAHANYANALANQGGHDAAVLAHYETALKIDPALPWVHLNLALYLSRIPGREEEAIREGEEAIRLKPDYLEAYNGLAIIFAQQGRLDEAKASWEKALSVDPSYQTARQNLALLERMKKQ